MFKLFLLTSTLFLLTNSLHTYILCVFIIFLLFINLLVSKYIRNVNKIKDQNTFDVFTSF